MNKTRAKDMLISGLLTGLLTGLCWSFVIELFSTDQVFDGVEMLCSLSVPALVALLVWRMWGVKVWVLLAAAYLTLMIPLLGIGIGGCQYPADDAGRHDWRRCLDFTVRNLEVLPIQAITAYIKPREAVVRVYSPGLWP